MKLHNQKFHPKSILIEEVRITGLNFYIWTSAKWLERNIRTNRLGGGEYLKEFLNIKNFNN